MLMEKQIMEQHLQETAGELEEAERELSRRNSAAGTPSRADSEDGSPRQQTPSLRQTFQDDVESLREENGAIMQVGILDKLVFKQCLRSECLLRSQTSWTAVFESWQRAVYCAPNKDHLV